MELGDLGDFGDDGTNPTTFGGLGTLFVGRWELGVQLVWPVHRSTKKKRR